MTDALPGSGPLCYLSHHKCATMYANVILGQVAEELGIAKRTVYRPKDFGGDLPAYVERERPDLLCYLDMEPAHAAGLGEVRGVHVIRDPRDILVSAYFSHLHSHQTETWPELREHRRRLEEASKEEGLFLEMEFSGYVFEALQGWEYGRDGILERTFEQIAERPYQFWLDVVEHLGLLDRSESTLPRSLRHVLGGLTRAAARRVPGMPTPRFGPGRIPAERLLGIVHDHRYSKKSGGRSRGEADPTSHYRKGEPGDWKNHLTEDHLRELERLFPQLIERTGYEEPKAWDARPR